MFTAFTPNLRVCVAQSNLYPANEKENTQFRLEQHQYLALNSLAQCMNSDPASPA